MNENMPNHVMVLQFERLLTHSVWVDFYHQCRTLKGLKKKLKTAIISKEIVGYRFMSIHVETVGLL